MYSEQRDIQTKKSPAPPMAVRGMMSVSKDSRMKGVLLAKHLMQHILQRSNLVGSKRGDTILQATLVDGANLVGGHFAVAPHDVAFHPIGVAVDGRRNGNDDDRVKMLVQFLRTDNSAGTDFSYKQNINKQIH